MVASLGPRAPCLIETWPFGTDRSDALGFRATAPALEHCVLPSSGKLSCSGSSCCLALSLWIVSGLNGR